MGLGLSSTGPVDTLMGLARSGEAPREFSGEERMEGAKESPSWREGLSSSFLSLRTESQDSFLTSG